MIAINNLKRKQKDEETIFLELGSLLSLAEACPYRAVRSGGE